MKRIGEILVENKLITPEQLDLALARQKYDNNGSKIGEILIDLGFLTYDSLLEYLERQISRTD
jgi:type IV pilus assembly protein PilB